MEIPPRRKKHSSLILPATIFVVVLAIISYFFLRANNEGDSSIDRTEILTSKVVKDDFLHEVRAAGSITSANLKYLATTSRSRVTNILLRPGAIVDKGSVIMELENNQLFRSLSVSQIEVELLKSELEALKDRLTHEELTVELSLAEARMQHLMASYKAEANQALSDKKIVSDLDMKQYLLEAELQGQKYQLEEKR